MVSALIAAGLVALPPLLHAQDKPPAAALAACCTPGDKDYPTHSGNLGNQGYSALTQINQANIKNLTLAWTTRLTAGPARKSGIASRGKKTPERKRIGNSVRFASAGAEFRIAIAGPLVSLVLGVLFVLVAAFAGLPDAIDGVVAWLGYTNLILLAFNLLPALPLDGGRVLRSALWYFRGDLQWATWVASGVGRGFGFLLIALGLFMFIVEGAFSGAWLAFVGWFLLQAATAEARYIATQQALDGLKVRDVMIRQPVTVEADLSLGRFMDDVASSRRYTTYPVLDQGRPIGLLAFRSVAAVPRDEWNTRRVRDAMIPREKVPLLDEDESAIDALAELSTSDVNRGLVVDNGRLAGFLSITDLARALEVGRPSRPSRPLGAR
jgi:CBS domain-containing protein